MRDIRCPRCGSLMGRVDGEAQLRCRRARCYAIVNSLAVYGDHTGAGDDANASNGLLSSAGAVEIRFCTCIHSYLSSLSLVKLSRLASC